MASLARRVAPAAALGGLALVIVGVADPALAGHTTTTATGSAEAVAQPAAGSAATARAGTSSNDSAGTSSGTSSNDSAGTSSGTSSNDSNGTSNSTGTTTTGSCTNGQSVTGDTVQTRWGPVQVAGTVVDGKLCEAHAVVWPTGDGRSIQINDYAIPQLDAEFAQTGKIVDGVSGATYTSQGYYESLQSILDKL